MVFSLLAGCGLMAVQTIHAFSSVSAHFIFVNSSVPTFWLLPSVNY